MTAEPIVLAIETSCDETAAAVLEGERTVRGHVILSQDEHEVFGGVVPELAARAHLQKIDQVVQTALDQADLDLGDVDAVAVTAGPGLIGALLVGVAWARAAAWALEKPVVPVHHLEAHLFGPSVEDPAAEPPFVGLIVSGGHTLLVHARRWGEYVLLGETRDDAAGEAFDKVAKMLGLPYPGGPHVEACAREGDPEAFDLPRPMLRSGQRPGDDDYYDFSFSGLKTAVATLVRELEARGTLERDRSDVAAAFQAAAVDVLVAKTVRAVEETGCRRVLLGGGVSANEYLFGRMRESLPDASIFRASKRLSLDNAAMVARAGLFHLRGRDERLHDFAASASLPFPGLIRGTTPAPADV